VSLGRVFHKNKKGAILRNFPAWAWIGKSKTEAETGLFSLIDQSLIFQLAPYGG
jgi:hypothetical protein